MGAPRGRPFAFVGPPQGAPALIRVLFEALAGLLGALFRRCFPEPRWLGLARREVGFHETGVNLGIERYVKLARCVSLGDPGAPSSSTGCSMLPACGSEAQQRTDQRSMPLKPSHDASD
jgi:hypothetical protein